MIKIAIFILISAISLNATTYYVNIDVDTSGGNGLSKEKAFASIQQACNRVSPGDTVIVSPGVYYESPVLQRAGTAEEPIVFRADRTSESRVIVSGANAEIRNGDIRWEQDEEIRTIYSLSLPYKPSRVLYGDIDLLPFDSLESLKRLTFASGYPGTQHGFAWESGRLYVRLHPDGKYGSSDPNDHVMKVSPEGTGRAPGQDISTPKDWNFGILTQSPAHVILQGFTFETPGTVGVFVNGSDVTVRDCWFIGCRGGVAGKQVSANPRETSNRIIIEHCDYTQFPAFDDMVEVIEMHCDDPWRGNRERFEQKIYWWQRKGDQEGGIGYETTYETGIALNIGSDWVVRSNYIHDALEGLSMWGTDWSRNLQVYGNRFERLIDNAIESENHASDLYFYHNEVVDVFEPFSWQPLNGLPWPGPIYIYQNLVISTPQVERIWNTAEWKPGIWKLGASERNWNDSHNRLDVTEPVQAAGVGFLSFNNTIYCPDHVAVTRVQSGERAFKNFQIFNNVFVLSDVSANGSLPDGLSFSANVGAFLDNNYLRSAINFTGDQDKFFTNPESIGWANEGFALRMESPAIGVRASHSPYMAFTDAGAIPFGYNWDALVVGPRVESLPNTSGIEE